MEKTFVEWIDSELEAREWTRADLARKAGITESSLSLIYSGGRSPGKKTCDGIAKAFRLPPDQVYRIAGILPMKPNNDETVTEIVHIYHLLNEDNKDDLLDYAKNRLSKQERGDKKNVRRVRVS